MLELGSMVRSPRRSRKELLKCLNAEKIWPSPGSSRKLGLEVHLRRQVARGEGIQTTALTHLVQGR